MHVISIQHGDFFLSHTEKKEKEDKIAQMCLYKESFTALFSQTTSKSLKTLTKKMKKMKVVAFVMLISLFLLSQVLAEFSSSTNAETSSVSQIHQTNDENQVAAFKRTHHHRPRFNCGYACARRCRETSRKKVCYRACGSCCAKCQCVPPGTSGNTASCPCYATLRTHGNKLKCP